MTLTAPLSLPLPSPRTPLDGGGKGDGGRGGGCGADPAMVARWYEDELRWATADGRDGAPVRLLTGLRFDVLELPAAAGFAVLRRLGGSQWPVALAGPRMRLLVAAGSADELPGLLDWLEWGGIALDLAALGAGGRMTAPIPPGWSGSGSPGAAVWLRPPEPGREVEPTLPALPALGAGIGVRGGAGAPSLVRLVDAAASECHRVRLLGAEGAQRLASS